MKLNIGKHKLEFFDSIDALPLERFNAFNKYVMLDSELGSTVFDFDKVLVRVHEFLRNDMITDAQRELMNIRIVYNNILEGNNVRGLAFASMIKKMNGKEVEDFDSESLNEILKKLSKQGLDNVKVCEVRNDLKKK